MYNVHIMLQKYNSKKLIIINNLRYIKLFITQLLY